MNKKAVVLDRDGTLIKYVPYLHHVKNVQLIRGVSEALRLLKNKGYKLFLHTNQSGVSREYFTLDDAKKCNNEMIRLINLGDNLFDKICIATDLPSEENSYRKPSPRFGNEIMVKFNIDKSNLIYVGDNISDLETAKNIGCRGYGLNCGVPNLKTKLKTREDLNYPILNNLLEVTQKII